MTNSRQVSCFVLGCTVGVVAALILTPDSRQRAAKYLRRTAIRGVDYAKTRAENVREVVDDTASRASKVVDSVVHSLNAVEKMIASMERLRQCS
jgi:hypothetical protein